MRCPRKKPPGLHRAAFDFGYGRGKAQSFEPLPSVASVGGSIGAASSFGASARPRLTSSGWMRSEEHTSELQSLMRISYAVFCLKKKKENKKINKKADKQHMSQDRTIYKHMITQHNRQNIKD